VAQAAAQRSVASDSRIANELLMALPQPDYTRIARALERVSLRLGDMLYEPDQRQRHAYFPTTSVISLHYVMESGASAETAAVGRDGVLGVALFMGGNMTPSSAVVQIAGDAFRFEARALMEEFDRGGAMQELLLRYMQALIVQTTQTAVCNRHHSVEQQLCRWLLGAFDRTLSGEFVVTQEMIAGVLGVRRESVTEAAGVLQRNGLIRTRRGHVTVLDRSGLERSACECYGVVARESLRLLSGGFR
jgi:CRP-like cAMP-binding protein